MKEITEVNCDGEKLHDKVELMQTWGWEFVSNQSHYDTNTVTFSREKDVPWYDEVVALEAEYNAIERTNKANSAPVYKRHVWEYPIMVVLFILYLVPGFLYIFLRDMFTRKKWEKEWLPILEENKKKQKELRAKAEEIRRAYA